ncbi:MAG: hypothetical protein GY859_06725 [Desulfobacterales bacterium]|nr:hypothetical protein [Desulfobacterales bacterium]
MKKTTQPRLDPFHEACREILTENPEAIGVAYKGLNCGCALLCGVTVKGDPIGALVHVSGQPSVKGLGPPICLMCKKDSGLDRVVMHGMHWPGEESEKPEEALRLFIGEEVFGPGYSE